MKNITTTAILGRGITHTYSYKRREKMNIALAQDN